MRILLLGNNWVGWQVARWLKEQGEEIVGAVIHPPNKQQFTSQIVEALNLPAERIYDGSRIQEAVVRESIKTLTPEIGVSVLFDYILKPDFLDSFPRGVVNLHPSLLPYNRGQYPNVWSIVDGTSSGVTLHYVDAEVDTGDIIAQKEVPVEPTDTGKSLYRKLEQASLNLFQETWPLLRTDQAQRRPQVGRAGTSHRAKDVEKIDSIDLDRLYSARDLINILRARTFPPYKGAYFTVDGQRIYLRLQLETDNET